ncbi:MAG: tetratricopeptide repeat protein [Pirellulaceae bacterium]|nr:tetratricopeptide repeat protein [Pirellulaceae bacterium]
MLILVAIVGFRRDGMSQQALEPGWSSRAEQALANGQNEEAVKIVDQAVAIAPNQPSVFLVRGMVYFRLGRLQESLNDFDKSIELAPNSKPECWQRGITLYYLGRFEEGRDQFAIHRTVNPNDVENPFWHFLCVAKSEGIEAARSKLLPVGRDSRPPLMEVFEMLRGNAEPAQVIEAANEAHGGPNGKTLARFYGHLYVGLYFDCLGQRELAKQHLEQCVAEKTGGYMRDVAVLHLRQLSEKKQ